MKFREFTTESGKKVFAGKSAEQNEELMKKFIGERNLILHTEKPGSPFCVIEDLKPSKKDIKETAFFCASRSKDWRDNKSDVAVHLFKGEDCYKTRGMKVGTFGVKKFKILKVRKKDVEEFSKAIKTN